LRVRDEDWHQKMEMANMSRLRFLTISNPCLRINLEIDGGQVNGI